METYILCLGHRINKFLGFHIISFIKDEWVKYPLLREKATHRQITKAWCRLRRYDKIKNKAFAAVYVARFETPEKIISFYPDCQWNVNKMTYVACKYSNLNLIHYLKRIHRFVVYRAIMAAIETHNCSLFDKYFDENQVDGKLLQKVFDCKFRHFFDVSPHYEQLIRYDELLAIATKKPVQFAVICDVHLTTALRSSNIEFLKTYAVYSTCRTDWWRAAIDSRDPEILQYVYDCGVPIDPLDIRKAIHKDHKNVITFMLDKIKTPVIKKRWASLLLDNCHYEIYEKYKHLIKGYTIGDVLHVIGKFIDVGLKYYYSSVAV